MGVCVSMGLLPHSAGRSRREGTPGPGCDTGRPSGPSTIIKTARKIRHGRRVVIYTSFNFLSAQFLLTTFHRRGAAGPGAERGPGSQRVRNFRSR